VVGVSAVGCDSGPTTHPVAGRVDVIDGVGSLAGQHVDYLQQALDAYKNGRRKNAVMNGMAAALATDADVAAVAAYFAAQKSPLSTVPRK
jgi:cytochrome c553